MMGKQIRLKRIFRTEQRSVILPMDDALISGPTERLLRPSELIRAADDLGVDAILAHAGTLSEVLPTSRMGRIQNLSASTLASHHTRKVLVGSVQQAVAGGADAVAVHVNITSTFEREMLVDLGLVIREAQILGIPVVAIAYPRSENTDGSDDNYDLLRKEEPARYRDLIAHCVRIAVEIGADIVKTQYTGTAESFSHVVRAACSKPVVVAGGPLLAWQALESLVSGALHGGAAGVSIGRNVHQVPGNQLSLLRNLVELVHNS